MPAVTGVLETSLYVADVRRAGAFYQAVFGFQRLDADDRFTALEVPGRQVLLLFARGASSRTVPLRLGAAPCHLLHPGGAAPRVGGAPRAALGGDRVARHLAARRHEPVFPRP